MGKKPKRQVIRGAGKGKKKRKKKIQEEEFEWEEHTYMGEQVGKDFKPSVYIAPRAWSKMQAYARLAEGEISGMGFVEQFEGDLMVTDVMIYEQESGHADTDLDTNALAKFVTDMITRGEDPSNLKLWWHSHGTMGVFWSATDDNTATHFGNDYMVSVVTNKRGEYRCRIDMNQPFQATFDGVSLIPFEPMDKRTEAALRREVNTKVKKKTYAAPTGRTIITYQGGKSFMDGKPCHWDGEKREYVLDDAIPGTTAPSQAQVTQFPHSGNGGQPSNLSDATQKNLEDDIARQQRSIDEENEELARLYGSHIGIL